jgi:hypothetical protein
MPFAKEEASDPEPRLCIAKKNKTPLLSVRFPSGGFASLKRDDAGPLLPGFPY